MARVSQTIETQRERREGALACLGNVLVITSLIQERVALAMQTSGQQSLLAPALSDLANVRLLVRRAQCSMQDSGLSPRAGGQEKQQQESSESSQIHGAGCLGEPLTCKTGSGGCQNSSHNVSLCEVE